MAEAGWYPDPYGMADERWWDGALWTVAERAVEAAPPAAVVEPARRGALGRLRNLASAHADKKAKSAAAVL
ncbi:MAG TPA: DUF2510 domain-containing protein, partial [Mycobacteriales bacterium]|nr:DUF2510 domain-containing protein [Mycobacteriales bacterium]